LVRRRHRASGGFTLLELIAVMFIISVLAGIALPRFQASILAAREAVLAEDLYQLRDLIDQYYIDKGRYPPTLEALVEEGYLRKVPSDPFTGVADWEVVYSEPDASDPGAEIGVFDVHSNAAGSGSDGRPYSEW
jgi:general secretion pathway protein G